MTEDSRRRRFLTSCRGPGRAAAWRRHTLRRIVAAGLAGAAAWVALAILAPAEPEPGRLVVTASTDLPVGHRLGPDDVSVRRVADPGLPGTALADVNLVLGRLTTSVLTAGEVVTTARIHTPSALAGLGAGQRAVHLPLADPAAAELVQAGDRVDVVSVGDGRVVGVNLVVIAVDRQPEGSGALGVTSTPTSGIVVAAPAAQVGELTRAALGDTPTAGVHLALRPAVSLS